MRWRQDLFNLAYVFVNARARKVKIAFMYCTTATTHYFNLAHAAQFLSGMFPEVLSPPATRSAPASPKMGMIPVSQPTPQRLTETERLLANERDLDLTLWIHPPPSVDPLYPSAVPDRNRDLTDMAEPFEADSGGDHCATNADGAVRNEGRMAVPVSPNHDAGPRIDEEAVCSMVRPCVVQAECAAHDPVVTYTESTERQCSPSRTEQPCAYVAHPPASQHQQRENRKDHSVFGTYQLQVRVYVIAPESIVKEFNVSACTFENAAAVRSFDPRFHERKFAICHIEMTGGGRTLSL